MTAKIKIVDKNCRQCGNFMKNVSTYTQICDNCREVNKNKKYKREYKPKYSLEEYESNFNEVIKESYMLTTKGFDEVSKIKMRAYRNYFNLPWCEVVKMYGKLDVLCDYIKEEYLKFLNKTGSQNISHFAQKYHKYITWDVINWFGTDEIMKDCGVRKLRYTKDELYQNFISMKNKLNRVPLFHEFEKYSKIDYYVYANAFNLKGNIYDEIVKKYSNKEEYNEFIVNKRDRKTEVGKVTGAMSSIYSDEDYEKEFRRVFEYCEKEYGQIPSRRLFNELSKHDDRTYRKKFNISWTEVCEMYGYEIEKTSNKSEKLVLDIVKEVTNSEYEPQKTFEWLIGVNNYPLFCDGYYKDINLVIEFDGQQHSKPVEHFGGEEKFINLQANDRVKDKLIPENGIKLIRISCYEPYWNKDFIKEKLITNGIKVS